MSSNQTPDELRAHIVALKAAAQAARNAGDLDLALKKYQEAALHCTTLGSRQWFAHTVRHIADILLEQGNVDQAGDELQTVLALYRKDSGTPPLELANTLRLLAILHERRGEYSRACESWMEAKGLYADIEVDAGIQECLSHLQKLGNPEQ